MYSMSSRGTLLVLISFWTNNPIDVHVRCRGDLLESALATMVLPRDCHVSRCSRLPRNDCFVWWSGILLQIFLSALVNMIVFCKRVHCLLITLVILENFVNMYKSCDKFTINRFFLRWLLCGKGVQYPYKCDSLAGAIKRHFCAFCCLHRVVRSSAVCTTLRGAIAHLRINE